MSKLIIILAVLAFLILSFQGYSYKKWSVKVVDGGVSAGKRTQIFRDFRLLKDPHVLVCHPRLMAHGLVRHGKTGFRNSEMAEKGRGEGQIDNRERS